MKTLVCTGGIGAGKSYVTSILNKMGYPVYNSDYRTKELYNTNKDLLNMLTDLLGKELLENGRLNRQYMAQKIFADKSLLEKVNSIVHPFVYKDFINWRENNRNRGVELVLFESAIFFESPMFKDIADYVLVVSAPLELRISRVSSRDNLKREDVINRINKQASQELKEAQSDFIIFADDNLELLPQIYEMLNKMRIYR